MDIRTIAPGEVEAFLQATTAAFHGDLRDDQRERWGAPLEPARAFAAVDADGMIVGTAAAFTRTVTVPGGAAVPAAHTTMVGVRPTHRRQGVLTRLIGALHEAAPEALAVLWASEAGIYGRFGYGPATRVAELKVETDRAVFRADAPPAAPVRVIAPADVVEPGRRIHARVRETRAGLPDRDAPAWWARIVADPEADRKGAGTLRAAVTADGDGYALYAVRPGWGATEPAYAVVLHELLAATPQAHAALWRFLCGFDLVRSVTWELAPADEALPHLLVDPRAVQMTVGEGLWVALLDVPRALAQRGYAEPLDVVLEVDGRRVRLRAGAEEVTCEADPGASADLRLGREALGSAYLGATTLTELHGAGRVDELRPGALAVASRALRAEREPWCPEIF